MQTILKDGTLPTEVAKVLIGTYWDRLDDDDRRQLATLAMARLLQEVVAERLRLYREEQRHRQEEAQRRENLASFRKQLSKGQVVWAFIPETNSCNEYGQEVTILKHLPNGRIHVVARGDALVEGSKYNLTEDFLYPTKKALLHEHQGLTIPEHGGRFDGWDYYGQRLPAKIKELLGLSESETIALVEFIASRPAYFADTLTVHDFQKMFLKAAPRVRLKYLRKGEEMARGLPPSLPV